jgi:hypothetical protein
MVHIMDLLIDSESHGRIHPWLLPGKSSSRDGRRQAKPKQQAEFSLGKPVGLCIVAV